MVVSGGQGMGGRGQGMGGRGRSYPVIREVLAAAAEHRFEPVDGEGGAHAHIEAVAKPVHGQTRRWHRASISFDTPVDSVPDEVGNPVQSEVIRGHQRPSEAVPRHKATRGLTRGAISMPISMQSAYNQHAISVPRHRATRFGMLSGPNHGASGTRTEAD